VSPALLVRHAQSEWNASGRWQGWADPPLTELGQTQARRAGERLRQLTEPLSRAVSSDLDRARTTAEILAGLAGSSELLNRRPQVEEVSGLRELDVGEWSGLTRAQIASEWPDTLARWDAGELDAAPGGEALGAFDRRVRSALTQVLASHLGQRILIVAHGGVVRSVGRWLGAPAVGGLHVAGFWLDHEAAQTTITGTVDLLATAATSEEPVPDDSAGAV
jgi:broad specificity phosphatase PhoE